MYLRTKNFYISQTHNSHRFFRLPTIALPYIKVLSHTFINLSHACLYHSFFLSVFLSFLVSYFLSFFLSYFIHLFIYLFPILFLSFFLSSFLFSYFIYLFIYFIFYLSIYVFSFFISFFRSYHYLNSQPLKHVSPLSCIEISSKTIPHPKWYKNEEIITSNW